MKKQKLFDFIEEVEVEEPPGPDVAICSTCGWKGSVSECEEG